MPQSRPPSNWAQIIQATISAGTLAAVIFGYFYTVQPIATKQRAEEERDAAILNRKSIQAEFEIVETKLREAQAELKAISVSLEETSISLRRYVIEFYIREVGVEAATFEIRSNYFSSDLIEAAEGGRSIESSLNEVLESSIIRKRGPINPRTKAFDEYLSIVRRRAATGGDVLRAALLIDEMQLLSPGDREKFLEVVNAFAGRSSDRRLTQRLQFQPPKPEFGSQLSNSKRPIKLSTEFLSQIKQELDRVENARNQFSRTFAELTKQLEVSLAVPVAKK